MKQLKKYLPKLPLGTLKEIASVEGSIVLDRIREK